MPGDKSTIKKVLNEQYYAVLSSSENEQPYSNLVAFVASGDLKSLVFATGRRTNKYARIINNCQVSLLIDNRTNQPSDILRAVAITVIGVASELQTNDEDYKALFIRRHPLLQKFINGPATAMISVKTSEYVVAHFDHTERFLP